jgi:glycosyltransferase involved in cell wall biosynthesis
MRVLIVGSMASSLRNFRGALIEDLLSAGHDVHVAAPGLVADVITYDWLRERGVTCHDVPLSRTGLIPIADLRALAALYRLMRRVRPDVMLGYTIKPVVWGLIASWMARVPQRVAMITGLGYAFAGGRCGKRGFVRWIASHLYGIALPRATLVFFQNPDDRDDLRRWGILPSTMRVELVNGTGVDTEAFAPAPFPDTPPRFLLIARLLRDKGIREYAQAASRLRARYPQAEFHLVGPVDTNPQALSEAEVGGWNDAGDLIWHGALSDVRPAIAAAHVYVLPSYREGLPRTVLESMSMGRAVITTNAPGCRETVQDGLNGFLVPVRDIAALEAAMEKFILMPELVAHMGAESRRIAIEKYDVRKVNAAMIAAMGLA